MSAGFWVADYACCRLDSPDTALLALADHAPNPTTKATFEHLVAAGQRPARAAVAPRVWPQPRRPYRQSCELGTSRLFRPPPMRLASRTGGEAAAATGLAAGMRTLSSISNRARTTRPGRAVWELFERHRNAAEAEQIAWVAATTPVYSDECYTDCVLSIIVQTYLPYWRAFPKGAPSRRLSASQSGEQITRRNSAQTLPRQPSLD